MLAKGLDRVVIATGSEVINRKIKPIAADAGAEIIFGDDQDVLSRFIKALTLFPAKYIARINGDNPFFDYTRLRKHLEIAGKGDYDYLSVEGVPLGLKTEIVSGEILKKISSVAAREDMEHITISIRRHPEKFKIFIEREEPENANLRLTIDECDDYQMVSKLVELYPDLLTAPSISVIAALKANPQIAEINRRVKQTSVIGLNIR